MKLKLSELTQSQSKLNKDEFNNHQRKFLSTVHSKEIGFYNLVENENPIDEIEKIYQQFKSKKNFVHVGIGGSSLGPEMLLQALGTPNNDYQFHFINNIDSNLIHQILSKVEPKNSLFHIVSKSGGTAETIAALTIIANWLEAHGISQKHFNEYFIFTTDPLKGDLRALAGQWQISTLNVPPNVGGRFSILTAVGLLPARFAGIDLKMLFAGAREVKKQIENPNWETNNFFHLASATANLQQKHNINQTVIMPYSSQLREFSAWFVQLWAESLGKVQKNTGRNVGLTPIPAYGATDQHSQVQLFMEGPLDKLIFLIEVEKFAKDISLANNIQLDSFKALSKHTLNQLLKAELEGTKKALELNKRHYAQISIDQLTPFNMGQLILFSEALVVVMSQYLDVDPFNQPGVEAGKIFAYEWLKNIFS